MANGHPHASRYPLATVWYEAQLVTDRVNRQTRTEALLLQAAIGTALGGRQAVNHFNKLIKRLDDGN